MEHIVAINDKGVRLIADGRYNDAILVLSAAIQCISADVASDHLVCLPLGDVTVEEELSSILAVPVRDAPDLREDHPLKQARVFPIFASGLIMTLSTTSSLLVTQQHPQSSSSTGMHGAKCRHVATAVLLYNIGLSYHLMGVAGEDRRVLLGRALTHYELATDLLVRNVLPMNCQVLLPLAIFNNKGHIYSHFFEDAGIDECLAWLRVLLDVPPQRGMEETFVNFRLTVVLHLNAKGRLFGAPAA